MLRHSTNKGIYEVKLGTIRRQVYGNRLHSNALWTTPTREWIHFPYGHPSISHETGYANKKKLDNNSHTQTEATRYLQSAVYQAWPTVAWIDMAWHGSPGTTVLLCCYTVGHLHGTEMVCEKSRELNTCGSTCTCNFILWYIRNGAKAGQKRVHACNWQTVY